VSNGVKHGCAKHVRIGLISDLETLTLTIKDDGVGIGTLDPQRQGMGLRIMHYRAGMIGASIAIEKQRSGGTRVTCSLPKEQNGATNS
jgi:signal transduction histidine kinase